MVVQLNSSTDIVEFEDIVFTGATDDCAVKCLKGANISFRRCWFKDVVSGVYAVGNPSAEGWEASGLTLKVTFEECVFENCGEECAAFAYAVVMFINCTFKNSPQALCITGKVMMLAKFCHFEKMELGFACEDATSCKVYECTFREVSARAIHIRKSKHVSVQCCVFDLCGTVLQVEGPKRSEVKVENCLVKTCSFGAHVSYGKIDLIMRSVTFVDSGSPLIVYWDVTGNVDMIECHRIRSRAQRMLRRKVLCGC